MLHLKLNTFSTTAYRIYIVHKPWKQHLSLPSQSCWNRYSATTTTCPMWSASGGNTETQRCSSGSRRTVAGNTSRESEIKESVSCDTVLKHQNYDELLSFVPPFCVHVSAGGSVCLTVPQCTTSTGLSGVDMKQNFSSWPSITPCSSWRIRQKPSAHLAPTRLWISLSTVSLRVICLSPSLWW